MSDSMQFTLRLEQLADFRFNVGFDLSGVPDLLLDEPKPLGAGEGPNAARLVAAAVANCLSASLLFSLRKRRLDAGPIVAQVTGMLRRNENGRYRIGGFDVVIHLGEEIVPSGPVGRTLDEFEAFCIVTQSVREGIPVNVRVEDAAGRVLHESVPAPTAGVAAKGPFELQNDPGFSD